MTASSWKTGKMRHGTAPELCTCICIGCHYMNRIMMRIILSLLPLAHNHTYMYLSGMKCLNSDNFKYVNMERALYKNVHAQNNYTLIQSRS